MHPTISMPRENTTFLKNVLLGSRVETKDSETINNKVNGVLVRTKSGALQDKTRSGAAPLKVRTGAVSDKIFRLKVLVEEVSLDMDNLVLVNKTGKVVSIVLLEVLVVNKVLVSKVLVSNLGLVLVNILHLVKDNNLDKEPSLLTKNNASPHLFATDNFKLI